MARSASRQNHTTTRRATCTWPRCPPPSPIDSCTNSRRPTVRSRRTACSTRRSMWPKRVTRMGLCCTQTPPRPPQPSKGSRTDRWATDGCKFACPAMVLSRSGAPRPVASKEPLARGNVPSRRVLRPAPARAARWTRLCRATHSTRCRYRTTHHHHPQSSKQATPVCNLPRRQHKNRRSSMRMHGRHLKHSSQRRGRPPGTTSPTDRH
jgi:hypothetical protein